MVSKEDILRDWMVGMGVTQRALTSLPVTVMRLVNSLWELLICRSGLKSCNVGSAKTRKRSGSQKKPKALCGVGEQARHHRSDISPVLGRSSNRLLELNYVGHCIRFSKKNRTSRSYILIDLLQIGLHNCDA